MERSTNQHLIGGEPLGLQKKDQNLSLLRAQGMDTKRPEAIQFACVALYKFLTHSLTHSLTRSVSAEWKWAWLLCSMGSQEQQKSTECSTVFF